VEGLRTSPLIMTVPNADVPPLRISPSVCLLLADYLTKAIETLRTWNFRVQESSRLPLAVRRLRETGAVGVFPSDPGTRVELGNAIRAALDYPRLCQALTNGSPDPVRDILRRSLGGMLSDNAPTEAHQAQSELRVVSAVAASGRNALIPPPNSRRRPDIVVHIESLPFAMEVKRPASETAITSNIEAAIRQLNDFGSRYSAICMDLTDCLAKEAVSSNVDGGREYLSGRFQILDAQATAYIGPHQGRRGYDRVALIFTMATPVLWTGRHGTEVHPMLFAGLTSYPRAASGLIVQQTRALARTLESGFQSLGASL
jgi:hypothetical protein